MRNARGVAVLVGAVVALLLPAAVLRGEAKLPVLTLKYDGSAGVEEDEEEETVEQSAWRHAVTLRIREELGRNLVTSVSGVYARKRYLTESGSYQSAAVAPSVQWRIAEFLKWDTELGARRMAYDEVDSYGLTKDFTDLDVDLRATWTLIKGTTLSPRLAASFELYDNAEKSRQRYTVGLAVDSRLGVFTVGADYRAVLRCPLGLLSAVELRVDHAFGVDLSWDPN